MRKMKDSGIEWIGEIPEDWECTLFKNVIEDVVDNRGKTPPLQEIGIPMLEIDSLTNKYPDTSKIIKFISQETYEKFLRKYLECGDILFATVGSIGKTSIIPEKFNYCIAQNIVGFRPNNNQENLFWFYYVSSHAFKMTYLQYNKGNIQSSIKISNLMSGKVVVPPLKYQIIIANYLDEKVSKIDNIILKTQETIEEYKKYKQSVITEAVTKGLNPNVEMKDSGIEWIGEIPEDWESTKLKNLIIDSNSGEVIDKSYWNIGNEILYSCSKTTIMCNYSKFPEYKRTSKGDLLLTRNATPYIFIPQSNSIYTNVVQRIKLKDKVNTIFIKYMLESSSQSLKGVGDIIESFNMNVWGNIWCVIPSLEEQELIVKYLDEKVSKIDNIISKKQELITQLEQYKESLIYEYVTGKKEVSPFYAD